jgi:5-formyltetrahydrofolate cyclo-ligase
MMQSQAAASAKKAVRQRMIALRDTLSLDDRNQKSAAITSKLVALPDFGRARTIAAFASFGTEFDTDAFLSAALSQGKRLVLPRIEPGRRELCFHFVVNLAESLVAGQWGIREPDPSLCAEADPGEIDFMLVPGVAFTPACERLGYGGGFYDVAMGNTREDTRKVAAVFDLQIVDAIPLEPHDKRVDQVVTERASYVANARKFSTS